jgi:hypothetical protein
VDVDPELVIEAEAIDEADAGADVTESLVAEVSVAGVAPTEDVQFEASSAETSDTPALPNVGFVAMPGSEAEIVDNIYGAFDRAAEEPEKVVEPPKEKQRFTPVIEDEEPAENPFDVQVDVSPFGDGATTLDDVEADVVEDDFDIAPSTKTSTDEDLVVTDGYDLTSTFEIHAPVTEVDVDAITASFSADQALRNSSPGLIMNIGAAVAEQDTHFFDVSDGPVIDLSAFDPSRYFTQATDRSPLKDALPKRERASIVEETKQDLSSMAPPAVDFPTISFEPAAERPVPAETAPVGDAPPQDRDARSVLQMLRELAALRDDEQ